MFREVVGEGSKSQETGKLQKRINVTSNVKSINKYESLPAFWDW